MVKETLAYGLGAAVGIAIVVAVIVVVKKKKDQVENEKVAKEEFNSKIFADKLRENKKKENLKNLVDNQSFVDTLSTKELTTWFKLNKPKYKDAKMLIAVPTPEHLAGLGLPTSADIDEKRSIIQLFYDGEKKEVLEMRMISFEEIDSNFQARIIEEDGMIVITE